MQPLLRIGKACESIFSNINVLSRSFTFGVEANDCEVLATICRACMIALPVANLLGATFRSHVRNGAHLEQTS